ncbi:MAG: hypothetical protein IKS52_03455 [Clostridia bacterium]|nr:hypothetical protein [Clostridia bacterium]
MKRVFRNGFILLMCAALVALGLSALLLSCHHCEGGDCPVCLSVGRAMRLAGLAAAAVVCAARLNIRRLRCEIERRGERFHVFSLFAIREELLI